MWRKAIDSLSEWRDSPSRKPLMVSGVRQCGKTYLLKEFGNKSFGNVLYIDLERSKSAQKVFEKDLDPTRILRDLSSLYGTPLEEGSSLLILDEVQSCPAAITSLKYFCEERRGFHVIAAGSLLGVLLADKTSYPVGKVDMMTMRPMDFQEWLVANGRELLFSNADSSYPEVSDAILAMLDDEYRKYLFVGGMPEAVQTWIDGHDEQKVMKVQDNILNAYAADFLKHVPDDMTMKVNRVWTSVPEQLAKENRRFFYSGVQGSGRGRELEMAVEWLSSAGLVHRVACTERPLAPLAESVDGSKFKLYVCDCGLLSRMMDTRLAMFMYDELKESIDSDWRGAVAESFVLSEIVSAFGKEPFYWKKGKHEVDFLVSSGLCVVPIEVKSGTKVRAISLKAYIDAYSPSKAILLSKNPPKEGDVVSLPLCMAWKIRKIVEDAEDSVMNPGSE